MSKEFRAALELDGFYVCRDVVENSLLKRLRDDSDCALERNKRDGHYVGNYFYMAHTRADSFLELFKLSPLQAYVDSVLSDTCIIHSYNGVVLEPEVDNPIQCAIHRDSPRFCRPYLLSLQILYMLDDFTADNGATYVLPGSHLKEEKPSEEEFFSSAIQLEGKAGDAVIFDAMLWHAGGVNKTTSPRRALTVVYTRSFMKQQIDLTKATPPEIIDGLNEQQRRLLGFDARVPVSLEEFHVPVEQRLYKPNQG